MIASLPEYLEERARFKNTEQQLNQEVNGEFVLYWMRTAVRTDENPALDTARLIASESNLPLLIYHSISEHYVFASDRHHTFMLEG
ncbi:hypothetical protein OAF96_01285, partial [bacterium]|nr:hypothetical protein [bacterium]